MNNYETVIGLEVHLQLSTRSKAFCGDDASFGGAPNSHVSVVSLGHPGTLPRLNEAQLRYAVRLGLALGCKINLESRFDRKNYFYTDLPKGYQITQDALPVCVGGTLPIKVGDSWRAVRIHHIHMEEDAGKSIHDIDPENSLIDLNRAGVPLLEIVTEPDLYSAEEVDAFMTGMRQLARYLGISDGNMQEGSMRCDVNISLREKGSRELGERCEIKNLNSMRFARQAIEYEAGRQAALLDRGEAIVKQTLKFDPGTGTTHPLRGKEDAHDYRYFPDPDLPPVVLTDVMIEEEKKHLPDLPWQLYERFTTEFGLSDYDAGLLTQEPEVAGFFLQLCGSTRNYKAAANLLINKVNPWLNENGVGVEAFPVPVNALAELIALVDANKVSASAANQQLFSALIENPGTSPAELADKLNLLQVSDENYLEDLARKVIEAHPKEAEIFRNGKKGLIGFFMGELMKASKGKADPKAGRELLMKLLSL
jgi:aspartyl-tRNA(Asn)/glutamyl-tRNA(Gln) amidotransferase subunit B